MLPSLGSLASRFLVPVACAVRAASRLSGPRPTWSSNGRTHIAVRGVHDPRFEEQARLVAKHVEHLPGVEWAELNAALGCLVVDHDATLVEVGDLLDAVDEVEESSGLGGQPYAENGRVHPANPGHAFGHAVVIGANLAGLGYASVARALPVPALPEVVPAMVTTADAAPRVRETLEATLGRSGTELAVGVGSALAHTLAQQPASLVTESTLQFCLWRERQAAQRSWQGWDERFGDQAGAHRSPPSSLTRRPGPLPAGPCSA